MSESLIPEGAGVWGSIAAGLVVISGALYRARRMVKTDGVKDTLIEDLQKAYIAQIGELQTSYATVTARADLLSERLDKMAAERNEALVNRGRLEAEVKFLEREVGRLTESNAQFEREIDVLKGTRQQRRTGDGSGPLVIEHEAAGAKPAA